ncbi:MAG: hypothetical protein R3D67_05305 [Hyphomicrobiaceae bacterium]
MKFLSNGSLVLLTAAVISVSGGQAFAQSAPKPANDGTTVREILGRAEVEAAKRTIGGILGAIAGPANAQTAPAGGTARTQSPPVVAAPIAPPAGPTAAPAALPSVQTASGSGAATTVAQAAQPQSQAPAPAQAGTPTDPSMLNAPPQDAGASPADASAPTAVGGAVPTNGTGDVTAAPAPSPSETVAVRVARQVPTSHHRSRGYRVYGAGCSPYRW